MQTFPVIVMLLADGVMCGLTGFGWLLQLLIYYGYLDWDKSGWIIQNVRRDSLMNNSHAPVIGLFLLFAF